MFSGNIQRRVGVGRRYTHQSADSVVEGWFDVLQALAGIVVITKSHRGPQPVVVVATKRRQKVK